MENLNYDEIYVDCSDDEKYGMKMQGNKWMPLPDEIIRLYEAIDKKETLELEWLCPDRRAPTPTVIGDSNPSKDIIMDIEQMGNSDFDFQEEISQTNLAVRPSGNCTPKGSAKKKTTTFDAVLSNFVRHQKQNLNANIEKN